MFWNGLGNFSTAFVCPLVGLKMQLLKLGQGEFQYLLPI